MELFPADDVDIDAGLQALHDSGFILRYLCNGIKYCQVIAWAKHQNPHCKEVESTIPAQCEHGTSTVPAPEVPTPAVLIPDSLIPDSRRKVKSVGAFAPPALTEVSAYCAERGKLVNPQQWLDHYTANGWKVGRNPMKDWKAAVRQWERNGLSGANQIQRPTDSQFVGRAREEIVQRCPLNVCDGSGWWAEEKTRKRVYCECNSAKRESQRETFTIRA